MGVFRALLIVFLFAVCLSVALYLMTGQRKYLGWAGLLFKLAVVSGLLFFGVLLLERLI